MRVPFEPHQISKLPKPTKKQTDEVRQDFKKGIRCKICGGWHHKDVVHLDYVGHAALTDRLLDCDPEWNWEPVAFGEDGTPKLDANGGMWITLTVCGVSRRGYGHPDGKRGGDAVKETIGDALRNAAMRFGAALDLWHKGQLHQDVPQDDNQDVTESQEHNRQTPPDVFNRMDTALKGAANKEALDKIWNHREFTASFDALPAPRQEDLRTTYNGMVNDFKPSSTIDEDEIPY